MVMCGINIQEHEKCFHYDHSELPMIEVRKILCGHKDEMTFLRNEIVFVMEGKIRFWFRDHPERETAKGEFFFIPTGGTFRYKTERKSMVLVIRLNEGMRLCQGFMIEQLYEKAKTKEDLRLQATISTLEINTHLWTFLDGLVAVLTDGLRCRYYFETKTQELSILLRSYYPKDKLLEFFSLILSPDTAFSEYVRTHFMKFRKVKDFAASMNLTVKQFTSRFNRVFGLSPYVWMMRERTRMIYMDLMAGRKDNKQIAHDYGFTTPSQLYDYCRENLGKTPGEIRRANRSGSISD